MRSINQLAKHEKPREKLVSKGAKALKNHELLSVLLGSGIQGKDVRKLSKEIISLLDKDFSNLSLEKLCDVYGLGIAKASQILASIELSKRYLIKSNRQITSAKDIYDELKQFSNRSQEHFLTITLDGASGIIIAHNHPSGTLQASSSDIAITRRLKDVSNLIGIELLDHVILSKNGFFSFCDEGLL